MVTATVTGHLSKVYQAMGYGALDAVDTPTLGPRGEITGAALLLHKIELVGKLVGKPAESLRSSGEPMTSPSGRPSSFWSEPSLDPLVILGASTGGPQALAEVLSQLPADLKASVIIIQHVDAAFAPGLGKWLAEQSNRRVTLAVEGHRPVVGEILLSGTDDHLILGQDHRLHYSVEPRESSYRPSVDVFFSVLPGTGPGPALPHS